MYWLTENYLTSCVKLVHYCIVSSVNLFNKSVNHNIVLRDCIHYSQHHLISVFNYSEQVYCFVFVVTNPRVPHWLYSFEIQITWFFHHSCANLYSTPSCFCSNFHPREIIVVNIVLTAMCRLLLDISTISVYIVSYIYLIYLLVEFSNFIVFIYIFVHAIFSLVQ